MAESSTPTRSTPEPLMTVDELIAFLRRFPDGKASVWINGYTPPSPGRLSGSSYVGWLRAARVDLDGDPALYVSAAWAEEMQRPDEDDESEADESATAGGVSA